MRLICGVLQLNGAAVEENLLRAMAAQMAPSLQPSLSVWHDGSVGMAILDFSADADVQALAETNGTIIAVDVRLDEPEALARLLGRDPRSTEDALFLAALETYGPAGLGRVLGDFAFASWDRGRQRLTCGRDIFGVRPLVYTYQPGKLFAFASLGAAIHGTGVVAKKIDEHALLRRMLHNWRHDDSMIAGIKRLPPAHIIEVSRRGFSLVRYWQLDRTALGTRQYEPDEAARELRRLVDQAVRCRLPRTGETGAHLSGGLDSSAVAVLAAGQLRGQERRLHAYSFLDRQRNDVTLEDESEFVRTVVEQEGDIDWTPIRPPAGLLRGQAFDPDTATALGADDPENAVCALAAAQGVSLILSGWGGDEAASFDGRGVLAELFVRGRWRSLAREIAALSRERDWPKARIFRGEVLSYVRRSVLRKSVIDRARKILGKAPGRKARGLAMLSDEVRPAVTASIAGWRGMVADACENRWRLITSPHLAARMEIWAQTGARYGVAFAFPLLDRRVVEFALSLPSEVFLRDGFRRRPFRDAMADVLPEAVRLRHRKYQASPSRMIDIAESRDEMLAKLDSYEKYESVRRLIDLTHLRRQIQAFPHPDSIRAEMRGNDRPRAAPSMLAALYAFGTAAYLEQHGGE